MGCSIGRDRYPVLYLLIWGSTHMAICNQTEPVRLHTQLWELWLRLAISSLSFAGMLCPNSCKLWARAGL